MTVLREIDWSGGPLVQRDPLKLGGAPNVDGIRITPEAIVDNYESGFGVSEIVQMVPACDRRAGPHDLGVCRSARIPDPAARRVKILFDDSLPAPSRLSSAATK